MSKFKKKTNVKQEIPTSSMPDVVFMLLFFFMVTTELRKTSIDVMQRIPEATQLRKLQRKSLVVDLYIGEPKKRDQGEDFKIQADDNFILPNEVLLWVSRKRDGLPEAERDLMTVSLKVDKETTRGIIADVETELRKANARRILYATMQQAEDKM
ncbi:MAG: biopolymer transporter ExbD [Bacteroidetes bacterium]|nr:biopolymer transporter ExbD [Bacteroidota bacterium]